MAGKLAFEVIDDFPKTHRVSGPTGPRETDVDVALNKYLVDGAEGVLKLLDYNTEVDDDGVETQVEDSIARQRAGGRVGTLKARGYSIENGWVIVSRNGCIYAKFFGPGNVPAEYQRKVGENVPV